MSSLKVSWLPPKYHHNQCWETTRTQYFSKRNSKWPSMRWIRNVDVLTYMHQSHWIHDIFALLGGNQKKQFFWKNQVFFQITEKTWFLDFHPKKSRYKLHQVYIYDPSALDGLNKGLPTWLSWEFQKDVLSQCWATVFKLVIDPLKLNLDLNKEKTTWSQIP